MGIFALKESNILSVHFMALLAASGNEGISIKKVADITKCSSNHLSKIADKLLKAGLITSKRGKHGGFYLKKEAKDIYIIDIIEAISGKIENEIECPSDKDICGGKAYMFGSLCKEISSDFITHIKKTKLEDVKNHAAETLNKFK